MEDSTKNYEAKINGLWYPVQLDGISSYHGHDMARVTVKWFKTFNGERGQARPFYSPSMGGAVNISSGSVRADYVRETADDPLTTVYPKKN